MKKLCVAGASIALALLSGGCATVMNGTSQPVEFQSDPTGAQVRLANGLTCETPCRYELRRGNDNMVTLTRDGFQPVEVYIQSRTGGGTFGNVLAGGIIGGVIDGSNGASNHLYPDPVHVRMVPIGSNEPAMLLDKKGEVISTVAEYNARVADDVRKGLVSQGLMPADGQVSGGQTASRSN